MEHNTKERMLKLKAKRDYEPYRVGLLFGQIKPKGNLCHQADINKHDIACVKCQSLCLQCISISVKRGRGQRPLHNNSAPQDQSHICTFVITSGLSFVTAAVLWLLFCGMWNVTSSGHTACDHQYEHQVSVSIRLESNTVWNSYLISNGYVQTFHQCNFARHGLTNDWNYI